MMPKAFTFRNGFHPEIVLGHIRKGRKIAPDGRVSYSTNGFSDDWLLVIISALHRPTNATEERFRSAIRRTIFGRELPANFTTQDFEEQCRRTYDQLLRGPRQEYRVVFEMSLLPERPAIWLGANGCRVYFHPLTSSSFSKAVAEGRAAAWKKHLGTRQPAGPRGGLMSVVVHVSAHSITEARGEALDALDEIRGLMNFVTNERRGWQISSGPRKPINRIRLATMQTVHNPDGTLASEDFWYEREWFDTQPVSLTNGTHPLITRFNSARLQMAASHKLCDAARVSLRQYARALDDENWKNAFLELWVILEFLTGTANADYDRLVSRASYMFSEHEDMREVLQHLRARRNNLVHTSSQDADAEQLIFQAKRCVEPLIEFYVANPFRLANVEDVRHFLDLPKSREVLRNQRSMLNKAIHFRRPLP